MIFRYHKDPLEAIARNKDITQHLRANGIDFVELRRMLHDPHGITRSINVTLLEEEKRQRKEADKAVRNLTALITNKQTTKKEKDFLRKMRARLQKEGMSGVTVIKCVTEDMSGYSPGYERIQPRKVTAKTEKQEIGLRVVEMYNYINKFITNNHRFLQNDVYDLIAELIELRQDDQKFTQEQIKNFHTNNFKFLDALK